MASSGKRLKTEPPPRQTSARRTPLMEQLLNLNRQFGEIMDGQPTCPDGLDVSSAETGKFRRPTDEELKAEVERAYAKRVAKTFSGSRH